jgi:hypothetical protein
MPKKPHDTARAKAEQLFREAFGERAERLFSSQFAAGTMHTVRDAFSSDLPLAQAEEVGFHIADWGSDAAFVVALHLFPERFEADEIREAIRMLAAHVPYHAAAVADILGFPGSDFIGSDAHTNDA